MFWLKLEKAAGFISRKTLISIQLQQKAPKQAVTAIHQWLDYRPICASPYLFNSRKGDVLTVPTVSRMVKQWCQDVGLKGNYCSHSLRKTWGYHQRLNGAPLPLLTMAFGHGSQEQTLQYLGIQEQEISDLYDLEL